MVIWCVSGVVSLLEDRAEGMIGYGDLKGDLRVNVVRCCLSQYCM